MWKRIKSIAETSSIPKKHSRSTTTTSFVVTVLIRIRFMFLAWNSMPSSSSSCPTHVPFAIVWWNCSSGLPIDSSRMLNDKHWRRSSLSAVDRRRSSSVVSCMTSLSKTWPNGFLTSRPAWSSWRVPIIFSERSIRSWPTTRWTSWNPEPRSHWKPIHMWNVSVKMKFYSAMAKSFLAALPYGAQVRAKCSVLTCLWLGQGYLSMSGWERARQCHFRSNEDLWRESIGHEHV